MDLGPAKLWLVTDLSSRVAVDLHLGKRDGSIAGEGPEDPASTEL